MEQFVCTMKQRSSLILLLTAAAVILHQGKLTSASDSEGDVQYEFKNTDEVFSRKRVARHLPGFCHEGWYEFGDKCYKPFGKYSWERKSWSDASGSCSSLNSNLVSIHSEEEQDFVNLLLYDLRYHTWIGLRRSSSSSEAEFSWIDSSPFGFTFWEDGEPNNYGGSGEECVNLDYGRFDLGKWNDIVCSSSFAYICQKRKDATLTRPAPYPSLCAEPQDWLKIGDSCYKVFHGTRSYATWDRAQSLCKSYGANLIYVRGRIITMFLRMDLKGLEGPFWTGIKSTKGRKYTWLGKHPLVFSNWQSDQPKEIGDQNNCVAVDEEGEWMVRDCEESHPFICEANSELASEGPTIAPYHPNMTCPYNSTRWHDFGGKYCYIIELGAQVPWDEASCRCIKEGGFLASFHSRGEVDVVVKYIKHHVKPLNIGFRRDTEGRFVWSDGSASDFTNWNPGEPNSRQEQCAEMKTSTGKWNDVSCTNRYGYVCSALKVPVKNETMPDAEKMTKGKSSQLGKGDIALIVLGALTVTVIIGAVVQYYFRSWVRRKSSDNVMSYSTMK